MAGTKENTEGLISLVCETQLISGSSVLNSIEGVSIVSIQDRAICYERSGGLEFRFFQDNTDAPLANEVIKPAEVDLADPGRWLVITGGGGGGVSPGNSATEVSGVSSEGGASALYSRTDHQHQAVGFFDGTNAITYGTMVDGEFLVVNGTVVETTAVAGGGIPTATIQNINVAGPTNVTDTMNTHARVNFAGAASVVLPAGVVGKLMTVKDVSGNANTNNITISAGGNIDGVANQVIAVDNGSMSFICVSTGPDVWDIN